MQFTPKHLSGDKVVLSQHGKDRAIAVRVKAGPFGAAHLAI